MKQLKNYVVKAKNIAYESNTKYINYLLSTKTKSHEKTKIINVNETKKEDLIASIFDLKYNNEKNYILNGKGGQKLKNIFKSLTLNIPKSYKVEEKQMLEIAKEFQKTFLKYLEANKIILKPNTLFNVIHLQDNPHFHFLIPTIDLNGNNIRLLTNKSFILQTKVLFSEIVDKVLDKKIENYEKKIIEHPQDKNKTMLESKAQFLEKKQDIFENKIDLLKFDILKELEKKAIEEKDKQYLKTTIDLLNRFNKDIENIEKNQENINIDKVDRFIEILETNYKNIETRIKKLGSYGKLSTIEENDILNINIFNKTIATLKKVKLLNKSNIRGI